MQYTQQNYLLKALLSFLGLTFIFNTAGCNSSRPYNVVNRFWQNSHEAVINSPAAMLLGNICDIHFQSLIFCNEQSVDFSVCVEQPTYAMITKIEKNHSLIPEDNKGYNTQPHEPNLNATNNSISHINIKAIPSLFNSSKLRKVINNASAFQNINMKALSENNFSNNLEKSLLKSCSERNVKYILPSENENQEQRRNRRQKIRRKLKKKTKVNIKLILYKLSLINKPIYIYLSNNLKNWYKYYVHWRGQDGCKGNRRRPFS